MTDLLLGFLRSQRHDVAEKVDKLARVALLGEKEIEPFRLACHVGDLGLSIVFDDQLLQPQERFLENQF